MVASITLETILEQANAFDWISLFVLTLQIVFLAVEAFVAYKTLQYMRKDERGVFILQREQRENIAQQIGHIGFDFDQKECRYICFDLCEKHTVVEAVDLYINNQKQPNNPNAKSTLYTLDEKDLHLRISLPLSEEILSVGCFDCKIILHLKTLGAYPYKEVIDLSFQKKQYSNRWELKKYSPILK